MYVIEVKKVIKKYDKSIYGFTEKTNYFSYEFDSEMEAIWFLYTTMKNVKNGETYFFKYNVEDNKYNNGYIMLRNLDKSTIDLIVKKKKK